MGQVGIVARRAAEPALAKPGIAVLISSSPSLPAHPRHPPSALPAQCSYEMRYEWSCAKIGKPTRECCLVIDLMGGVD